MIKYGVFSDNEWLYPDSEITNINSEKIFISTEVPAINPEAEAIINFV